MLSNGNDELCVWQKQIVIQHLLLPLMKQVNERRYYEFLWNNNNTIINLARIKGQLI